MALVVMAFGAGACATLDDRAVADSCAPSGELKFLCGMQSPEDLAVLPGTNWIVASGMAPASGLHLIDTTSMTWERWIAPIAARATAPYDKCPSQPRADELQAHGISVRDRGNGHATLYAVDHGGPGNITQMNVGRGREAIEVFDVDLTGPKPRLSWQGCVLMPENLVANSVVSGPDGALYATVMLHPENEMTDLWKGRATGAVYKWVPGSSTFQRLAGTELVGNNGIELSRNGQSFYVTSIGTLTKFTNTNPAIRLRSTTVENVAVDNIHWSGNHLVVAGSRTDLCPPASDGAACPAGYRVLAVNPDSLAVTTLADGGKNEAFTGISAALPLGRKLWLGSYSANRLAYQMLPDRGSRR